MRIVARTALCLPLFRCFSGAIKKLAVVLVGGDAVAIIPYMHYRFYGDKSIIEKNLYQAKKWIDFYKAHLSEKNLVERLFTYGDWLSVKEETDKNVMMQCFYGYALLLVAKMCDIVGEDSSVYKELHDEAKHAFRKHLINFKGCVISDTQTAYLVAYIAEFMTAEEIRLPLKQAIRRPQYHCKRCLIA